jgi:hypothetical protein
VKYVDHALAWVMLPAAATHLVLTEVFHHPRAVLETGVLWVLLAMFNFLRLGKGYGVRGLRTFCTGAKAAALVLEFVRCKIYGPLSLILIVPLPGELLFSLRKS